MSGPMDLAVPAVILKLHGWMPLMYRRLQERDGGRFQVGIVCALLFGFWIYVTRLVDCVELVSLVASLVGHAFMAINSLSCNYFVLLLLWIFSVFCVNRFKETEEKKNVKVEETNVTRSEVLPQSSTVTRLMNAEKALMLFQSLLYEEETLGTESESIEEKIWKLKAATKELKKIQIVINSLKAQELTHFHCAMIESRRLQGVIDKFEHTEAYVQLRSYALNVARRQLSAFSRKGMGLKIWLSEALEFQEKLHSASCSSRSDIQQHVCFLQGIRKDSDLIAEKLAEYGHAAQSLTTTLQEMSDCSEIYHNGGDSQSGRKRWHNILMVSVTEEAAQVAKRFSTVTKLNECYLTHLDGICQGVLQQVKS